MKNLLADPTPGSEACPLVSVIIPTFNNADLIAQTIGSALASDYGNFEIVVADDGSTDTTPEVVARIAADHPAVKYVRQPNRGLSGARNFGIKHSRGKYLLPLDADDLIAPAYLTKAVAILEAQPKVSIVYCRAEKFGADSGPWRLPEFSMLHMLVTNCIFCTAMFRRSDYDRAGGYCETLRRGLEDWDFWLSMLELGGTVRQIDEVLFYYRIRHSSMTFNCVRENPRATLEAIIERHRPLYLEHFTDIVDYAGLLHTRQQTGSHRFARAASGLAAFFRRFLRTRRSAG